MKTGLKFEFGDYLLAALPPIPLPVTIEMKVNISDYLNAKGLIDGSVTGNNAGNLKAHINTSGVPYFSTKNTDATETNLIGTTPIQLNTDSMITFVMANNLRQVYINGVKIAEDTKTAQNISIDYIGKRGTTYFYKGYIKQIRVWNIQRTASDIQASYDKDLTGTESGLVGYWALDEASGRLANDSSGNQNHMTISGASWGNKRDIPLFRLNIPTYDGNTSVTHPKVLYFPDGWNGYKYWMAFTPYPDGTRENPCIVVSNDGFNWIVPPGLTNPIDPYPGGTTYFSDTHLVMLPDGRMACYYRMVNNGSVKSETIYRKTTTDGITWSAKETVLQVSDPTYSVIMSPVIIIENGQFKMWTMNQTASDTKQRLNLRTSADSFNWSDPVVCTMPGRETIAAPDMHPWHLDIVKGTNVYRMLMTTEEHNLYLFESVDGITWTGSSTPIFFRSGLMSDANGNYRSSFLVDSENPLRTRFFVVTCDKDDKDWRIAVPRKIPV